MKTKAEKTENTAIELAMVDLVISATIPPHPNARTSKKSDYIQTTTTTPPKWPQVNDAPRASLIMYNSITDRGYRGHFLFLRTSCE